MLSISLDLGNVPSVLAALGDARNAQLVANAAAESFVDDTHNWIEAGHAFKPGSGQLQQSINWRPAGNGAAEVYANADYAGYVESGTGIHAGHSSWVIGPKPGRKGLKIPNGGVASPVGPQMPGQGYVLRRKVIHPGSKPHPFFFADMGNRQQHMQQRGLSVLASRIAQVGGNHV